MSEQGQPTMNNIHVRMVAVMRDLGAVGKDKKNEAQGFKYRGIDDVYNAINPVLAKHGVYMTAKIIEKSREERTNAKGTVLAFTCLRMCYTFRAEDGSQVFTEAEGEGMDSGDKSSNKAMAVAHKYALLQAFCIPTLELDDPDAHVHEVAAKPKAALDGDILEGAKNWVAQQMETIIKCSDLDALTAWLGKAASTSKYKGDWDRPAPTSALDKLNKSEELRPLFKELRDYYFAKLKEV